MLQSGVQATAMVDIIKQILFSKSESTFGKSAIYPQNTRPNVFVIPIIKSKNEAEFVNINILTDVLNVLSTNAVADIINL